MRNLSVALAMVFATSLAGPALADELAPNPNIEIHYVTPKSAALKPINERFRERRVLERLSVFLSPLKLPSTLKISAAECHGVEKPFNRRDGVVICYEVIAQIRSSARKAYGDNTPDYRKSVAGAVAQHVLYRVALGLLDVLDIPVWGRYVDAADKLASLTVLALDPENAVKIVDGTERFFKGSGKIWTGVVFAEPRAPLVQRFYNYACLAFGAYPAKFQHFKDDKAFLFRSGLEGAEGPDPRITDDNNYCTNEYKSARRDFWKVMTPYLDKATRGGKFAVFEEADF